MQNQNVLQVAGKRSVQQPEDIMRLQDLLMLCLAHWRWFVLSLAVALGIASYYLLSTPRIYQRKASIMIKEDNKGQSISSEAASMFSDMGLGGVKSNVNNELIAIQSPAVLLETGKQLKLDVNYAVDGTFHKNALYGADVPVEVQFLDFIDSQSGTLTVKFKPGRRFELSDFKGFDHQGNLVEGDASIEGKIGQVIRTPLGRIRLQAAPSFTAFAEVEDAPVLYVSRTSLYDMTDQIKNKLSVSLSDEKATIIDLSYKDVLTKRAEDVLNTIITVYRKNWMDDKNQMTVSTSHFITDRLGVIERELGDVDRNISSYKSAHLMPDVDAVAQQYMAKSQDVDKQILEITSRISMANYIRNFLMGNVGRNQLLPTNSGIESQAIEQQIAEYNKTQLERNNLVLNSSDQNPLVADYDHSLVSMRKAIISSIDNFVVTLNTKLSQLQANEAQTTSQIASNPDQAKYLQTVGRQQKVKEALYLFLLQKREENELSKAFTAYNTRVITPPTGEIKPVQPVRRNVFLLAITLGILIPVVIIFIRENMNTKVRGRDDLKRLTMPFLGEIPYSMEDQKKSLVQRIKFWDKPVEVHRVVVKPDKRDVVNEAFRVLRTNLEFMHGANPQLNVFIFTSYNPGSGKSHLAANIAMSLAVKKKRVIVVDGDLRHGSISMLVDTPKNGLSHYLSSLTNDINSLICHGENHGLAEGFDILPAGTIPPNPTELLYTDRLGKLVEYLRQRYDYVFFDCPPIEIVADTQIIEQHADRTIFVVRAGLMERRALTDLEQLYQDHKFKNMSLVLNGTKAITSRYGGYYRYGYHYSYHYSKHE